MLGQPHRALAAAGLLVDHARRRAGRRGRGASPSARAPARRSPRPRSGTSCPARRGPTARRRPRRPTTGRAATRLASARTVSTCESRHSVGPSPAPRRRATRFGRSSVRPSSVDLEARVAAAGRPACSWAGRSLPGGLTVLKRTRRWSSSVVSRSRSSAIAPRLRDGPGAALHRRASTGAREDMEHELALRHRRRRAQALLGRCPGPPAGRAPAAAIARRARGSGAPARRGLGAARRDRAGPAALDDPLRAARARARRRWRGSWPPRPTPPWRSSAPSRPGAPEVRKVLERAQHRRQLAEPTVFFLDEIHRFNKAQQDALLPAVEEGLVTLIGATTENPYFEVNSALLSRCQVYELRPLLASDIEVVLRRAVETLGAEADDDAIAFLAARAGGDARTALAAFDLAVKTHGRVTLEAAEDSLQRRALTYDKTGDRHYDTISAWIKATRGSDPDASLYYLAVMLEGGEDPRFIVRRMVILASEDIGNADPRALEVAVAAAQAIEHVGLPEGQFALAQASIYLSLAPKSDSAKKAIGAAREYVREQGAKPPPAYLQSAGYNAAARLGRGVGYDYPHDRPGHVSEQELLPDERGGRALLLARRRRGGAARAPGGDPPRTRAVASPPRGGERSRCTAGVLQPGHRRATGRGGGGAPARGGGRGRGGRQRAAAVGDAAPRRPRALHGPGGPGGHRRVRRADRPHRRRAGPAARRGRGHGAARGGRDAAVAGRARPRHPGRREDPLLAHAAPGQARALELRAAGRRRRPRSADRAVRHAAGRRRRGAHGRQRRGAQALAPRAAVRRADRARLRPRRAARGPAGGRPRPHRRGGRARRPPRWPRSASRARRAPGARSARRARAASRARCSRSTARTRCSCWPTPTSRARCAAPRGRPSPTPASAAARSSARCACPRSTIASWPGSCRRRAGCAWATRRILRPRSARSSTASASRACGRWSTRPSAPARPCTAAARARRGPLRARRCSAA